MNAMRPHEGSSRQAIRVAPSYLMSKIRKTVFNYPANAVRKFKF
jgi:hypothetical protein